MPIVARCRTQIIAGLVTCLLGLAACSGRGSGGGATGGGAGPSTGGSGNLASQCPLGAIAKQTQRPVQITMWESMTRANADTLKKLTDQFNQSQPDVHVNLVTQGSYDDTLIKYKAALGGGQRPDLVQIQDVDQQLVVDSRSIVPAQACVQAEHLDQSDFVPRVLGYYTVRGVQYAIPFASSNPILYYNKQIFVKAGLNPDKAPTSLDALRADAQKIVSSGAAKYGIAIKEDAWYLEEWLAMSGQLYANNGNGRTRRATSVDFNSPAGQQVFSWLSGMARDKLAEGTPFAGADNLLAVANGVAAMTMDSSAALGTIFQVLGGGAFKNVTLGVGPLPGPVAGGPTVPAGSSLFVVAGTSPAREEGAWRFAKFLTEVRSQAIWAAGTGYMPVRVSSTTDPLLIAAYAKQPELRVAYEQVANGANTVSSQGPVIGDMEGVRKVVIDAETSVFQGKDPSGALSGAAQSANSVIADYEARVGG